MSDDDLAAGAATLVCGTSPGGASDVCERALAPSDGERVVWVSYTRSPSACFAQLPDVPAERKTVVDVAGDQRTGTAGGSTATADGSVSVTEPGDLTGLDIAIRDAVEPGARLCFDSVTALLQYVETARAYTFLNTLLGHLWKADATAHFHLDPAAHDARTVAAVTSLFDARVEPDGTVRTRT